VLQTIPCPEVVSKVCWHPNDATRFCLGGVDKYVDLWDVRGMCGDVSSRFDFLKKYGKILHRFVVIMLCSILFVQEAEQRVVS
jgi:hypothetical protein